MYTAIALLAITGRQIARTVVTTQTISDALALSNNVHVQIMDTSTNSQITVSLSAYVQHYAKVDLTTQVAALISSMSDLVRASIQSNIPILNTQNVYPNLIRTYNPLSAEDIQVHWTSVNNPTDFDDAHKLSVYNDLVIVPSGTRDLNNTLVCVNGVIHPTVLWNGNLYVIDGMYTIRNSQRKDLTCINTSAIGGHTTIPLTPSLLSGDAIDALYLTLPTGQSFKGKTAFVVIDGYLYHPDEILTVVSDTKAILHGNRIPYISQYRHNPKTKYKNDLFGDNWNWGTPYTDPIITAPPVAMSSLPSASNDKYVNLFLNTRVVPKATLDSFDFQFSRITSAHSFVILMNTDALYCQKTTLYPTTRVGTYGHPVEDGPDGFIRYGAGLIPSYVKLSSRYGQSWYMLSPQDPDIDRIARTANPTVIPCLIDDYDDTYRRPCSLYSYFS